MKRTNLAEGTNISLWRGKPISEMGDQEYITTLEKIIKILETRVEIYKGDSAFFASFTLNKPGRE